MTDAPTWQNRIVGSGMEAPEQLLANPRNYRRHPAHQQNALKGIMEEVGWIDDVIMNQRTGFLLDGHLRVELAMREGQTEIPVKYVDLSHDEEAKMLATFDPIGALATADTDALAALLEDVTTQDESLLAMLSDLAKNSGIEALSGGPEDESAYSRIVESPVYAMTGECPAVAELVDETRASDLLARIDASSAPDDVKRFLRHGAMRHLKFDYAKVAEFYAHADAETQDLMERSALVIIDVDQAIEYGFARLASELREIAAEEADADAA